MTQNAPTASPAALTDIVEQLREENDIMRRHLNLHPDKPLGNELRAEVARLKAAMKDLRERAVEEGIHHFVNRIDAALEAKP